MLALLVLGFFLAAPEVVKKRMKGSPGSSYKRVKGRSHTVEKRKASHPQKPRKLFACSCASGSNCGAVDVDLQLARWDGIFRMACETVSAGEHESADTSDCESDSDRLGQRQRQLPFCHTPPRIAHYATMTNLCTFTRVISEDQQVHREKCGDLTMAASITVRHS